MEIKLSELFLIIGIFWLAGFLPPAFFYAILRSDYSNLRKKREIIENLNREQTKVNLQIQERLLNQIESLVKSIDKVGSETKGSIEETYEKLSRELSRISTKTRAMVEHERETIGNNSSRQINTEDRD